MVTSVSFCTTWGEHGQRSPDALLPGEMIQGNTTPDEFEAECCKYPAYKLNHMGSNGLTALHEAAKRGNTSLIEYIVRKGGMELLYLGSSSGFTPLFIAIESNKRFSAKQLLDLGSPPNMACPCLNMDENSPSTVCYKTPLAFAAEQVHRFSGFNYGKGMTIYINAAQKAQNVAMAKLLKIKGGIDEPKACDKGAEVLQLAEKEIASLRVSLIKVVSAVTESLFIPEVIGTLITEFVPLEEIPDNVPELYHTEWISNSYDDSDLFGIRTMYS